MKKILKLLFFAVIISVIILVFILQTSLFDIANIELIGLKKADKDDIIKLLDIYQGQNIFLVKTDEIKAGISAIPQVKEATIVRKLPNTLIIKIIENKAIAYVKYMNSYLELGEKGNIIRIVPSLSDKAIILKGIKINEVAIGERIKTQDQFALLEGLEFAKKFIDLNFYGIFNCRKISIDISNVNNFTVYLDKFMIKFGDKSNIEYKLKLLREVLNNIPKGACGEITLNQTGIATFNPLFEGAFEFNEN